jgi:hypothetical protein
VRASVRRGHRQIRNNIADYEQHVDYRIDRMRGLFNSFEREWFDMSRAGFLKYSFQLRIGAMAGAFVSYHNTREIFGFEFVPLQKIDRILFGRYSGCWNGALDLVIMYSLPPFSS